MTWLLKLYPPRWRRRYGEELAELLAAQPFSIGVAVDLMAGAIDAWLHPQLVVPATKGDMSMIARMRQLTCAGPSPDVTARDKVTSVTLMLGGTLLLTALWLWTQWQFGKNTYVTALSPMAYFFPTLLSLRYTSLKGRSARTQTLFIGGLASVLAVFFLLVGWLGTRI